MPPASSHVARLPWWLVLLLAHLQLPRQRPLRLTMLLMLLARLQLPRQCPLPFTMLLMLLARLQLPRGCTLLLQLQL
jgi:hypothetical protein